METKRYRVTGPCFCLDEQKALAAVPVGTIVEINELMGAVLMRWYDAASERREQYYTPEIWRRYVLQHIQPVESC